MQQQQQQQLRPAVDDDLGRELSQAALADDLRELQRIFQQSPAARYVNAPLPLPTGSMRRTLLHVAAGQSSLEMTQAVLAIPGVNANVADESRLTPLHLACCFAPTRSRRRLAPRDQPPQQLLPPREPQPQQEEVGDPVQRLVGVVKALLKAGADPHRTDGGGHTPLFWATLHGQVRVVEALLDGMAVAGRGIFVRNRRHHDTPLHWACSFRRPEVAQLLIERYSNNHNAGSSTSTSTYGLLTCRNKQGMTPLDVLERQDTAKAAAIRASILRSYAGALAHRHGTRCLHALLREAAASVRTNDQEQKLSFHLAVGILDTRHLEFLLECVTETEPGAVRTPDDNDDLLPLQRACQWNFSDKVIYALLRPYPDALLLL